MISEACKTLTEETIFEKIMPVVTKYKALHMAAGSPLWDTPQFLRESLSKTAFLNENLYGTPGGQPGLIKVVAEKYQKVFNRQISEQKEIAVAEGGTGILFHAVNGLMNEGDELITFEPFFMYFKYYTSMVRGVFRTVELEPPSEKNGNLWSFDIAKFEQQFNDRTRIVIVNTPHNPCGKIFSKTELEQIVQVVSKYPKVTLIADEVYENFLFDQNKELPRLGNLLWDRTISVYTTGKLFACTGWRVGFAIGPENLIQAIKASSRGAMFCCNRPCQHAFMLAYPLAEQEYLGYKNYYDFVGDYVRKNFNILASALKGHKYLDLYPGEGGFFAICNAKRLAAKVPRSFFYNENKVVADGDKPVPEEGLDGLTDIDITPAFGVVHWLAKEFKIVIFPGEPFFYNDGIKVSDQKGKYWVRISLCVTNEFMEKAAAVFLELNKI